MDELTIGERLRAAREAVPASLFAVSRETKIRLDYLQAMERDSFRFAAAPYVRGMLRAYAKWLDLDAESLAEEFDHSSGAPRPVSVKKIFRDPAQGPPRKPRSRWAIAAAVAAFTLMGLSLAGIVNPRETRVATVPAPPKEVAANPTQAPRQSTIALAPAVTQGVEVTLAITGDRCWMRVVLDGDGEHPAFMGTLATGATMTFRANQTIQILFGNLGAVRVVHNGRDLGALGTAGETKTLVFERGTVRGLG